MKVYRYKSINDIPDCFYNQLLNLCYNKKLGFMHTILQNRNERKVRWVIVKVDKQKVVSWCTVDNIGRAHCWTADEYRNEGHAPKVLAHLYSVIRPSQWKKLETENGELLEYLRIAKYLYRNNLY